MKTVVKKLYEAMFLVDSVLASSDWDGVVDSIKAILEKADAEIALLKKWNDCRLAYEIDKKSRGTYILCYFRAEGGRIQQIERDVQLSERFMRVLILNGEHVTEADLKEDTPEVKVEASEQKETKQAEKKPAVVEEKAKTAEVEKGSVDSEPAEAVKAEQDAKSSDVEPKAAEEVVSVDSEPAEAVKAEQDAKGSDVEPKEDVEGEEGK